MNENRINTIFFGNNGLILDCLIENSNVKSVFCQPLEKSNVNRIKITETTDKSFIPFHEPDRIELYNYIDYIKDSNPDLIVVCGYKYIIRNEIFNIPRFKSINIHPSYLPYYRGQHVVNWAIANGENETGVTIHFVDKGIDTGDIIVQKKIPILFEDSANTLHYRIYHEACELLKYVLNTISSGKVLQAEKQDDSKASYFRPRTPENGIIDWNRDGIEIYNLIRALVKPWPGAYGYIKGKKIIFWGAQFEADSSNYSSLGEIIASSDSNFIISVKGGKLSIDNYAVLDKNGNETKLELRIGDKFEKESD
ncbi:methionyl-tRNA formyltransferase [Methanosarcina sp. WWM596]|uniref:methionyl-tRNA formyltransferase n=1 Tax=Methanosarcina sp. WWM596 TaxID=1434103 RepID=UPI000615A9F3|nr:methionyl-tRNA formyltransferase [Methanosarcina sp. WWM596]AKB17610.1 Methionyl-tRNA formyltransferase [Methanosarcina sp. WWM596]